MKGRTLKALAEGKQRCKTCGEYKTFDQFHKHPKMELGIVRECKLCTQKRHAEVHQLHIIENTKAELATRKAGTARMFRQFRAEYGAVFTDDQIRWFIDRHIR